MTDTPRVLSLASAAALVLALSQPGLAAEETAATTVGTAPEAAAPVAPAAEATPAATPAAEVPAAPATTEAPAATPTPAEIARSRAGARRAEHDAERNQRYQDLRQRAAEVGLELPETPPWDAMPEPPAMPPQAGATGTDREAVRRDREAMREHFKSMTPEERKAMRDAHWQEMRERAAERGTEMPETPPWEEAEKRYKAAQEQFDRYRKIIDAMTEEQLEAARALFGRGENMPQPMQPMAPQMPRQMPPRMPPQMHQMPQMPQMPEGGYDYGYGPQGGYPGYGPYQGGPGAMGRSPMPYYEGGMEQAPPPPRGAVPY